MPELIVDLTIIVDTALSLGAGGSAGVLADKSVLRNARGEYIIPGSHVKGRLRHACEQLARALGHPVCESPRAETMCPQWSDQTPQCLICQLFGSPTYPSPLRFADLICVETPEWPTIRPGVSLNRRRGVAQAERLYFVETTPPGAPLRFHHAGAITGAAPTVGHAQLLFAGLQALYTWGGGKSRGLGWSQVQATALVDGQTLRLDTADPAQSTYHAGLEVLKTL